MNDIRKYIPSLLLSILLVFTLLAFTGAVTAEKYASPQKLISVSEENSVPSVVRRELEKHFKDKYNETGIPADVYMSAISEDYIRANIEGIINSGFRVLEGEKNVVFSAQKSEELLEKNIEEFFESYAEENGYEKDANYEKRLTAAIDSAYKTVREYCDVYKLVTLNSEGILRKAGSTYRHLDMLTLFAVAASAFIAIIIVLVNLKKLSSALYWIGVSGLVSGIIGLVPCIIISADGYFDRFVIKQPHIFTSFTKLLYGGVNSFMYAQLVLIAVSVIFFGTFIFFSKYQRQSSK